MAPAEIDLLGGFELTPVEGQENQWTFTMKRANAYFSVSYRRIIQASWIGNIQNQTYNGQEWTPEPSVRVNGTWPRLVKDQDYTLSYENNIDAGTATVTVTAKPESENYSGSASKTFTIRKKAVTVTASSQQFTYTGEAQSWTEYDVDGLVGSDAISAVVTGSITLPSESPVVNELTSYEFTTGKPGNYSVTTNNGQLTMVHASRAITITAASQNWTYDGQTHVNPTVSVTNGQLFPGDELVAEATGSVTNVEDSQNDNNPIAAGYKIMHGDEDVTENYVISTVDGTLNVTQRTIRVYGITAESKCYDGKMSVVLNYDHVTFYGMAPGDNLTVTASGKFENPDAGMNKRVLISDITLGNNEIYNYKLDAIGNQTTAMADISQVILIVTAGSKTISCGDEPANDGVTYEGFISGETPAMLEGELEYAYNTEADGSGDEYKVGSPSGTYYIIPSGLISQNYNIVYKTGTLTVNPKVVALVETADNSALLEEVDGIEANVTLTRTLQPGNWNTFAVPFDLSGDELEAWGMTVKELTGSAFENGALTLNFADAESIEAGKPYMVKVEEEVVNPTFENVIMKKEAVSVETDAVIFVPSLGKTFVTGSEGNESNPKSVLFLGTGNKLITPSVVNDPENLSSYIKGFRAFFQLKGDADQANIRIEFSDDEATEIEGVDSEQLAVDSDDSWYDLSGRKLDGQPTTKGVYIWKGKKVVIK